MSLDPTFDAFDPAEAPALAAFLASEAWPFHGTLRPTAADVERWLAQGLFTGDGSRTFWISVEGAPRVDLLAIRELDDPTPIFDLRVLSGWRRRGLARRALAWLARHVFTETDKHRIEGHTRADNEAMRRTFRAAGWVLEGYHRRAWPAPGGGAWHDAVTYALLKDDWRDSTRTPVVWDEPAGA